MAGGSATAGGSAIDAGAFTNYGAISTFASIQTLGLRGNNNGLYRFVCPALGLGPQLELWGTGVFTDDSPICWAAMHSGLISRTMGGEVFVEVLPGTTSYAGSFRNAAVSQDYGLFDGSYFVLGSPPGIPGPYDGGTIWSGTPVQTMGLIDWEENPQPQRGRWGLRFQYTCQSIGATVALGTIWGTDVYTDDSRICVAAAHVGVIGRSGGTVTVETVPGVSYYPSTNRNGVLSNTFGAYTGSFLVVP
jgi:hypothetical protein